MARALCAAPRRASLNFSRHGSMRVVLPNKSLVALSVNETLILAILSRKRLLLGVI